MAVVNANSKGLMAQIRPLLKQTPGRLWVLFATILIVATLNFFVQRSALITTRQVLQTITKDSVPSVVAAQEIRSDFHKLNGDVMASFLGTANGVPVSYDIESDRHAIADHLVSAAKNITYGEAEAGPIRTMIQRFPEYSVLASEGLMMKGTTGAAKLRSASNLLHTELVANAQKLDEVNRGYLDKAYEESKGSLVVANLANCFMGLVLLLALASVQARVAKMSHRSFNIPLVAASVCSFVLVVQGFVTLSSEREQIRSAKEDAFDSVSYLSQARANGQDARSLELLALTQANAAPVWGDFETQSQLLAATDDDAVLQQTYSGSNKPTFKGLLGNELRNITFDGEQEDANAELHTFFDFETAVKAVHRQSDAGNVAYAVNLALGSGGNSTEHLFDAMDKSIAATEKINSDQFDSKSDKAFASLTVPTLLLPILILAIIALSLIGIRQRVSEYSV